MGGHPYQYVVAYDDDLQGALDRLRRDVFERGDYHGAERRPKTPEQALERAGETGTPSILDILTVREQPDYSCAAPLTPDELTRYFGTDRPSVQAVEASDDFWEDLERGKARCLVVYDGGQRMLLFAGYSFD
jgi:hypothetical protein